MNPRLRRLMDYRIQLVVTILVCIGGITVVENVQRPIASAAIDPSSSLLVDEELDCTDELTIEAEKGTLYGAFEEIISHGENVVIVPNGIGDYYDEVFEANRIEYCFTVATEDRYKVAGIVRAPTNEDNSFWIRIDNGPVRRWGTIVVSDFGLDFASTTQFNTPIKWDLDAGDHIVTIYHREDGTELDKIGLIPNSIVVPTLTATVVPTATQTAAPTYTSTPLPTETPVPSATATDIATETATETATATPTKTPVPTATETPIPSATETGPPLPSITVVATTETPTIEPEATETPTQTRSATAMPTDTPVATETPVPETPTPETPAPTLTASPTESAEPTATTQVGEIRIQFTNTDFLLIDADRNDSASVGDTLFYQLDVTNSGDIDIENVLIFDSPDPDTVFLAGSVFTDMGQIDFGNGEDDTRIQVAMPALPSGSSASISFQVQIVAESALDPIENQAILTYDIPNGAQRTRAAIVSDDPDTEKEFDATVTEVGGTVQKRITLFLPIVAN